MKLLSISTKVLVSDTPTSHQTPARVRSRAQSGLGTFYQLEYPVNDGTWIPGFTWYSAKQVVEDVGQERRQMLLGAPS